MNFSYPKGYDGEPMLGLELIVGGIVMKSMGMGLLLALVYCT